MDKKDSEIMDAIESLPISKERKQRLFQYAVFYAPFPLNHLIQENPAIALAIDAILNRNEVQK